MKEKRLGKYPLELVIWDQSIGLRVFKDLWFDIMWWYINNGVHFNINISSDFEWYRWNLFDIEFTIWKMVFSFGILFWPKIKGKDN